MINRIFLFLFLLLFSGFSAHKFYVSVTQIMYDDAKKSVTITSRIFIDDIEKTLNQKYNQKLYLDTPKQHPEAKQLIKLYFQDNFSLHINNKNQPLFLESLTFENDILILVFKTQTLKNIKTISLKNTLLFDTYSEQQNLIHAVIKGTKKSYVSKIDAYYFDLF